MTTAERTIKNGDQKMSNINKITPGVRVTIQAQEITKSYYKKDVICHRKTISFFIQSYKDRIKATWRFYKLLKRELWANTSACQIEANNTASIGFKGEAPKEFFPSNPATTNPEVAE